MFGIGLAIRMLVTVELVDFENVLNCNFFRSFIIIIVVSIMWNCSNETL